MHPGRGVGHVRGGPCEEKERLCAICAAVDRGGLVTGMGRENWKALLHSRRGVPGAGSLGLVRSVGRPCFSSGVFVLLPWERRVEFRKWYEVGEAVGRRTRRSRGASRGRDRAPLDSSGLVLPAFMATNWSRGKLFMVVSWEIRSLIFNICISY